MVDADPASILRGPEPEQPPGPDLSALNGYLPRYDLAGVVKRPVPLPAIYGGLIYHGRVHTMAGPPEAGKTVCALWIALQMMKRGHRILMLDEETGPRQVADLLRSMGAAAEMVDQQLYYTAFNDLPWKADDIDHLAQVCIAWKPALTIFDSASEMLASAGIDENKPAEVTNFYKLVLRPVAAKHRSAVLLLDHDAKEQPGKVSRYARGTTAKLASPDVSIKLYPLHAFSRSQDGALGLMVSKDRLGGLHRYYSIRVTASPLALHFTKTSATEVEGQSMSPAAEKLLDVLTNTPMTNEQLVDRVHAKYGHGLRRETVSRVLNALADQGLVQRDDMGKGRPALWMKPGGALTDQMTRDDHTPEETESHGQTRD